MPLTLFNTFTKKKEIFTPLEKGKVKMYTCGPTVYGRPHIGNYSSFLMADLLRRWLTVAGFIVTHVKNITDVGHLTADAMADAGGEDKIEKQAREEKVDPLSVAKKYTDQYLEDEHALNLVEPEHRPRATETIHEMISLVESLKEKGYAYETKDGIYFSVEKFSDYGKLSGNTLGKLGKLQEGVRVIMSESKKHPADFALWKKCVGDNSNHVLRWSYPDGERVSSQTEDPNVGFPGWHIECSAMSTKFLGEQIDIHTGGEDNIFPHHECEIAQSECSSGKQFVKYWVHKRRVNFSDPSVSSGEDQKMSKSSGNFVTLTDITDRGFSALDLRYFFISSHYRSHTSFTWKGLEDAKKARMKIVKWMKEGSYGHVMAGRSEWTEETLESILNELRDYKESFEDAMNDDLNTPKALAVVFDVMTWSRTQNHWSDVAAKELDNFVDIFEQTFGCFEEEEIKIPEDIQKMADDREVARKTGDYTKSDKLRDAVGERGFVIEDLAVGSRVVPRERRVRGLS